MTVSTPLPKRSPLLPERRLDFFVCDILDAAPKGDMASMEHPLFSVSRRPDMQTRLYERGDKYVRLSPSDIGRATVYDRDILIYCTSQIIAAMNQDRQIHQTVRFTAHDFFLATNRDPGGKSYEALRDTLRRLSGTRIETNLPVGGMTVTGGFGLIESWEIVRKTRGGRMTDIQVKMSDWLIEALRASEVLTLSPDYFRLRRPLERRMYEVARKHCGEQRCFKIGLDKLQTKCGSHSSAKEFRRLYQSICDEDAKSHHMPDYSPRLEDGMAIFYSKGSVKSLETGLAVEIPALDPEVYEPARDAAPGWDVRFIEQEWRVWATEKPKNPEMAFLGFCRKWFERRGRP